MFSIIPILAVLLVPLVNAKSAKCPCLTDAEANDLATKWLHLWDTNAVSCLSDLASVLASNITSYDEAYGGPVVGIEAFLETVTAPGNYTTTDVKQFPLFVIHSCDQIATRWGYTALTTGYESTVPAGTPVELKGIEILHIDLSTRLIYNATSSADWIQLARQLGETLEILFGPPEGTLAMDVRGEVFCHLVNLYILTSPIEEEDAIEATSQVHGSCRLSFGWLSWTSMHEGYMVAKFEPDTIPKLNGRKEPLGRMDLQLGDTLWTAYRDALEHGISDPAMVWPDPNITPFSERLECLLTNMHRLRDLHPRILTKAWLESASG